ncbi:MAG TPA: hypothetical protein VGR91_08515 [Stellaceae bacterium]|nr:hypothetical protein [Stellaceae bacterium]
MTKSDYDAAIAAFLGTRGVTRCPTACLLPTQANVGAADRERLRRRAAEREIRRLERRHETWRRLFGPLAEEARLL